MGYEGLPCFQADPYVAWWMMALGLASLRNATGNRGKCWSALLLWTFLGPVKMLQSLEFKVWVSLTWIDTWTLLRLASCWERLPTLKPSLISAVQRCSSNSRHISLGFPWIGVQSLLPLKHVWPMHRMKPSSCNWSRDPMETVTMIAWFRKRGATERS